MPAPDFGPIGDLEQSGSVPDRNIRVEFARRADSRPTAAGAGNSQNIDGSARRIAAPSHGGFPLDGGPRGARGAAAASGAAVASIWNKRSGDMYQEGPTAAAVGKVAPTGWPPLPPKRYAARAPRHPRASRGLYRRANESCVSDLRRGGIRLQTAAVALRIPAACRFAERVVRRQERSFWTGPAVSLLSPDRSGQHFLLGIGDVG